MSPAAHVLDRRLHDLRAAQADLTSSLDEVEAEETYEILTSQLARQGTTGDGLSGTTAARARAALAKVAELRPGLPLLGELLDWASRLRTSIGLDEHRATELVSRLNSPTLALPDPAAGPRATRTMAPQDLVDGLEAAVAALRAVVTAVDAARKELPARIERATAEAERLALELPAVPSVAAARSTLADLAGRAVTDPLGAAGDLDRVQHDLAAARASRTDVTRLAGELRTAGATVTEIEALIDEGHDALARSLAETHEPWGLLDPLDREVLTGERGLRPWLARLERLVTEGRVALAEKGLASWRALADQTLDAARQVAAANSRPVARREELRRLLGAAQVKARASGRADDPRVAELADQAHRALQLPCDIDRAENRVDAYIDALRRRPRATPAPAAAGPGPAASDGRPGEHKHEHKDQHQEMSA